MIIKIAGRVFEGAIAEMIASDDEFRKSLEEIYDIEIVEDFEDKMMIEA